jgi:hypothetical protein
VSKLLTLTKMFAVWMVAGSSALAAVAWLDQDKPKPTVIAAAEPSLPCKEQAWPMIDRKCLKWTAPPKSAAPVAETAPEPARVAVAVAVEAAPPEPMHAAVATPGPAQPEPVKVEPVRAEPVRAEPVTIEAAKPEPARPEPARPEPSKHEPGKPEPVRESPALRAALETLPAVPRAQRPAPAVRSTSANEIHVVSRSANGAPRTIVVRPTNAQDALYYAARREAAVGPFGR